MDVTKENIQEVGLKEVEVFDRSVWLWRLLMRKADEIRRISARFNTVRRGL